MHSVKKSHIKYSLNFPQSRHIIRFGEFGIKSVSFGRLNKIQLLSIERSIIQKIKSLTSNNRSFKIWNLLLLNFCLTKLSSESRMGKGKGAIYTEAVFIKPGMILFEFKGLTNQQILEIFRFLKKRISLKLILIARKS